MSGSRRRVLFLRTDPANFDPRVLKETSSLANAGHSVSVFGWDRAGLHRREETVGEVAYRRARIPAPYGSKLLAFILPFWWLRALAEVWRVKPDVVHACDLDALVPALAARWLLGVRVVYDIFDHFADKISGVPDVVRGALRRIDVRLARRTDLIIVTDEHRRALIPGTGAVPVGIIQNVPPLVEDLPERTSAGGDLAVLYAGVIHEHRGLRLIAAAIDGLEGVRTTFAGWIPRRDDEEFLRRQAKISYIGKIPYSEAMKLTENSDVVLALYDPEVPINRVASSNKVFEAMAAGVPVISNAETTMAPLIDTLGCGVTIPYGDPSRLRDALAGLRDDPARRAEMGRRGRSAHLREYNWTVMERRLLGHYDGLPCGRGFPGE